LMTQKGRYYCLYLQQEAATWEITD
jgi:hypothetical protein